LSDIVRGSVTGVKHQAMTFSTYEYYEATEAGTCWKEATRMITAAELAMIAEPSCDE